MGFLIVLLIILCILFVTYYIVKRKVQAFLLKYFGTKDFHKAIELSEIEAENTPKSISGMESVYKDTILKDFPDVNLNELKSMVEQAVIECFRAIESKNIEKFKYDSSKAVAYVQSRIDDYKNKDVNFDQIHFHKTVLSKYENKDGVATMYFQTSLEYYLKIDNKPLKKVQDRYKVNFIYIIDREHFHNNAKAFGLNCPNCGAPISDVGNKSCKYCGALIKDLVKKTWIFNNIERY